MRLRSVTRDRLTLEERPWFLGSLLIAVIVFLLALALLFVPVSIWASLALGAGAALFGVAFALVVRRTVVILDRSANAVVIREASLVGTSERRVALTQVIAAEVETVTNAASPGSSRRASVTTRPVLRTLDGTELLTPVYSGGTGAVLVADAINDWLSPRDG